MRARSQPSVAAYAALSAIATAIAVTLTWLHPWNVVLSDYGLEAAPAYAALRAGHLLSFARLLPPYGGSLELRAPFAMLPTIWNGSARAVYRLSALPCLLAGAALGVWLAGQMWARGARWIGCALTLVLCVANPLTERALVTGHPEELLGAVLCVASVLAALRGRATWAGLALGLAIANKEWGLLATGPVLLALPAGRRRAMLIAAAVALALDAPLALVSGGALASAAGRLSLTNTVGQFHTQQVFWFIGSRGHWVPAMGTQILRDFRVSPGWLDSASHPLIIWISLPLTLLCARRPAGRRDPLLLLALLLLLRCALDPWDELYYALPFIICLLTWEALTRRTAPLLAAAAMAVAWLLFHTLPPHLSGDGQALAFLIATVPAVLVLAVALYRPLGARGEARERAPVRPWPTAA